MSKQKIYVEVTLEGDELSILDLCDFATWMSCVMTDYDEDGEDGAGKFHGRDLSTDVTVYGNFEDLKADIEESKKG